MRSAVQSTATARSHAGGASCDTCCRDWESHPACQHYTMAKRLGEVTRQHSAFSRDQPHGARTDVRWLLTSGPDAEQLTPHHVLAAVHVHTGRVLRGAPGP